MRVRLLLGSLCCLLLPLAPLLADSHRADSGFYVAVRAGSAFTDPATGSLVRMRDDYGSGYLIFYDSRFTYGTGVSVNGAAGYAFGALRLEAELSYAVTDLGYWTWEVRDDQGRFVNQTVVLQRLNATGLTANLWYDIDTGTVFSPFLGGGAGAVFQFANEAEWPVSQGSAGLENYEFLWATGFGITYHLGAGIGVEVGAGVDARVAVERRTHLHGIRRYGHVHPNPLHPDGSAAPHSARPELSLLTPRAPAHAEAASAPPAPVRGFAGGTASGSRGT